MKKSIIHSSIILLSTLFLITGCQTQNSLQTLTSETNMKITSPNFENNGVIPDEFTCKGLDISPELHIEEIPHGTKSLALIMDDPDAPAGTWTHWVMWNIPKETKVIPKKVGLEFAKQGNNSWPQKGYGGPCPPSGTHRYYFRFYALTQELELPEDAGREQLEAAMENRIINQAILMGIVRK